VDYFLNTSSYLAEILALLISIYLAFKHRSWLFSLLMGLMVAVVLTESLGKYGHMLNLAVHERFIISNISMWIEGLFFYLIFIGLIQNMKARKVLIVLCVFHTLLFISGHFWWQPIHQEFSTYAFIIGAFGVLVAILLYFYERLKLQSTESIFTNFWTWFAMGLFIFLAGEIPIMSTINYLSNHPEIVVKVKPILMLKYSLSTIYYIMFLVGLLCMTKTSHF